MPAFFRSDTLHQASAAEIYGSAGTTEKYRVTEFTLRRVPGQRAKIVRRFKYS